MNWTFYKPKFVFEKYLKNKDSAWFGHFFFAYDLVRNKKPKTIVELGTHRGHSFFAFSQGTKDAHLRTKLFAIDSWEGDSQAGYYEENIFKIVNKIKNELYAEIDIQLLRGYFQDYLTRFQDNTIDILHIDGLHTYQAVKKDFEDWLPKLSKDGIVLLHDVTEKKKGFGVYKFFDELETKYKTIKFTHSHGLGVVFFQNNRLYSELKENEEVMREMYNLKYSVSNLEDQLKESNELREEYTKNLNKMLLEKEAEIKKINFEVTSIKASKIWKLRIMLLPIINFFKKGNN